MISFGMCMTNQTESDLKNRTRNMNDINIDPRLVQSFNLNLIPKLNYVISLSVIVIVRFNCNFVELLLNITEKKFHFTKLIISH